VCRDWEDVKCRSRILVCRKAPTPYVYLSRHIPVYCTCVAWVAQHLALAMGKTIASEMAELHFAQSCSSVELWLTTFIPHDQGS
jgi:hypothetical protein